MAVKIKKPDGRKLNKKIAILAGLIAALILFALAPADNAYAYSNPDFFLKQGVGARQLGMGNTGTALGDDAAAVFFNPAGLARLKNVEQATMHSQAFDFDIKYDFASLVLPLVRGKVIALSGAVLRTDQIPITKDRIPNIVNYTEDKEQVTMLSYGQMISRKVSLGLTVKDIRQQLYFKEAKGNEADFGLLYTPSKTISLGLNLQDITPGKVKWTTGVSDEIPYTIRGGIAFKLHDWGSILTIDADKVESRDLKLNAGWEYQFNEMLLARVGMNDGQGTAGFSLYYKSWRFDYAYMKADLGEIQRVSATARFGSFLFENFRRKKRPSEPQCGDYALNNNAKCDKAALVNGQNPNSKIASYPKAGSASSNVAGTAKETDCVPCATGSKLDSKKMVMVPGVDITAPQPDINKALASDNSPVLNTPRQTSGARAPREKIIQGNKLVLAGRYDEAVRAFRESLDLNPKQEEAHVKLAGIYQYQKLYSEAIEEYKEAIATNPTNPDNYISISSLYAKVGAFDKAFEACDIVTKMAPGTDKARIAQKLCDTFAKQGAPVQAASSTRMTLKTDKIDSPSIEEDNNNMYALEITPDDESAQKASKSSKTKKKSSKAKKTASKNTKKKSETDSLKSARADAKITEKEQSFLD